MIAFYVIIAGVGLWAAYTTRNGFPCRQSYKEDVTTSSRGCDENCDNDKKLK